jgi:hypothetical protein
VNDENLKMTKKQGVRARFGGKDVTYLPGVAEGKSKKELVEALHDKGVKLGYFAKGTEFTGFDTLEADTTIDPVE